MARCSSTTRPPWASATSRTMASRGRSRPAGRWRRARTDGRECQRHAVAGIGHGQTDAAVGDLRVQDDRRAIVEFWMALRIKLSSARPICAVSNVPASKPDGPSTVIVRRPPVRETAQRAPQGKADVRDRLSLDRGSLHGTQEVLQQLIHAPDLFDDDVQGVRRRLRSGPLARAFSAFNRMAAIGFRISCATPATTRPSAAAGVHHPPRA